MKPAVQFVVSLLSLGTLLAATASHATNVADLPLKASVLAKPNVVFAMDDSGSMDAEVMLNGTFQGWFYPNYTNADLYPGSAPRSGSNANDWNMFYLFPTGTGAGNKVYGDPADTYGYAIPPTPQMAWLRSPTYNTIYYDTNKTYVPWSPAYYGGATQTYGNANSASAKSHPALGATTVALNADLTNNNTNWRFTWVAGMTIPAGVTDIQCFWGAAPGALPFTVTARSGGAGNGLCKGTMTYYPATFWHREACAVDGTTCVTAYDGNTLKRYEIKAATAGYPSGRSYADEMQNFANWFQYYRKRRMMLAAAMGEVLEDISGLRMGVVAFNNRVAPTMYDADSTSASTGRLRVAGIFYQNEGSGGTPTHQTMSYIHNEFDTNTNIIQYACQRNAEFIITDGFANDGFTAPPAYVQATYGAAAPYQAITANSLADKALGFFTYRLRATASPLAAGKVPLGDQAKTNPDPNTNLHLTTYALTLGMRGSIWPSADDPFVVNPAWPAPVSNTATMIDDLWHATINGRGQMYLATDVAETALAVRLALTDILAQTGAQGGLSVSTKNLARGDSTAYYGSYNPAGWVGDVTAHPVDQDSGQSDDGVTKWSASTLLLARDWTTRVIAASTGAAGVSFTAASVGATVNPGGIYGTDAQVVDYLRGDRTHEGTLFRQRSSLIGAIINSVPEVDNDSGVVYVQSGEGMLHAIDTVGANAGAELWAFVPNDSLKGLGEITERGYAFGTKLDGTPVLGKLSNGTKLLVAGSGAAGRSFTALDVTNPRGLTDATLAARFKWQFPAAGDAATQAKVGQALGRPVIVQTAGEGDVVLVTSGYNSTADGKGRLWMLNATTGAVIHEFVVADGSLGTESGLSQVSGFLENNGKVKYVYGGDLLGSIWRFDLDGKGAPFKLATLKGPTGTLQPVTSAPELMYKKGKRIVIVGTGRLLDIGDFGSSSVQSIYAIADGAYLSNARTGLVQQTYNRATDTMAGGAVDWSSDRGWFLDLSSGEQINTDPVLDFGVVTVVSNVIGGNDCSAKSYAYVLDPLTGQKSPNVSFISFVVSNDENSSGVTLLKTKSGKIVATGRKYSGDSWDREILESVTIDPSKNAWREIRR